MTSALSLTRVMISTGDRIGRAADWTLGAYNQKYPGKRGQISMAADSSADRVCLSRVSCAGRFGQQGGGAVPTPFNFFANEEVGLAAYRPLLFTAK